MGDTLVNAVLHWHKFCDWILGTFWYFLLSSLSFTFWQYMYVSLLLSINCFYIVYILLHPIVVYLLMPFVNFSMPRFQHLCLGQELWGRFDRMGPSLWYVSEGETRWRDSIWHPWPATEIQPPLPPGQSYYCEVTVAAKTVLYLSTTWVVATDLITFQTQFIRI